MKKGEMTNFFKQFAVKDGKEFKIVHPLFTMDRKKEVSLSDPIKNLIAFSGDISEGEVAVLLKNMCLNESNSTAHLLSKTHKLNELTVPVSFSLGVLHATDKVEFVTPWFLIGHMLSLTEQEKDGLIVQDSLQKARTQSLNRGLVGLAITDARVLYCIDNDEKLFDIFGYLGGGDVVFEALINEERANRIPKLTCNTDVLAWCVINNKITDISEMPCEVFRILVAEDEKYIKDVPAAFKKYIDDMGLGESGSGSKEAEKDFSYLMKATTISDKEISELTIQELAFIVINNKCLRKHIPTYLYNEIRRFGHINNIPVLNTFGRYTEYKDRVGYYGSGDVDTVKRAIAECNNVDDIIKLITLNTDILESCLPVITINDSITLTYTDAVKIKEACPRLRFAGKEHNSNILNAI